MRHAVVAAVIVAMSGAAEARPMRYDEAAALPCFTVNQIYGTPRFTDVSDAIVDHVMHYRYAAAFGSACNITDYIAAICKSRKSFVIGQAVDYLFRLQGNGAPLPEIHQCGA